jgi:hypothetical protein
MYTYTVKVPKLGAWLWGGEGIEVPLDVDCLLICQIDEIGDTISVSKKTADGTVPIGDLKRYQTYTISLKGARGLFARPSSSRDSVVKCALMAAPAVPT